LLGAFVLLHGHYGSPLYTTTPDKYEALLSLNGYSAAILCVIAAWMYSAAWSDYEKQDSSVRR
jgi:hypothetical protein